MIADITQEFTYYCITENKYIVENRKIGDTPTKCMNNHPIKSDSICVKNPVCEYMDDPNIPLLCDLTKLNYNNMSDNEKKICQLFKSLLMCAKHRGLINI